MVFTEAERVALAILPKVSGLTSALLSSVIVVIIFRQRGRNTTYDRLILGASVSDVLSSLAFFCSTWPILENETIPYSSGTPVACNLQGFTLQMAALASSLYSSSLSIYFWLVIGKNWNERRLARWECYLHAVPISAGLVTAIIALAFRWYGNASLWCWITSDYDAFRLIFFYGPVWLSILVVTITCAAVCWRVRQVERKTTRFRYSVYQDQNRNQGVRHGLGTKPTAGEDGGKSVLVPNQIALDNDVEGETSNIDQNDNSDEDDDDEEEEGEMLPATTEEAHEIPKATTKSENVSFSTLRAQHSSKKQTNQSLIRASSRLKRTRVVGTRCFCFAASFYFTWTAISVSRLVQWVDGRVHFWLFALATATTPIQGLSTFCIYLYPKLVGRRHQSARRLPTSTTKRSGVESQ